MNVFKAGDIVQTKNDQTVYHPMTFMPSGTLPKGTHGVVTEIVDHLTLIRLEGHDESCGYIHPDEIFERVY